MSAYVSIRHTSAYVSIRQHAGNTVATYDLILTHVECRQPRAHGARARCHRSRGRARTGRCHGSLAHTLYCSWLRDMPRRTLRHMPPRTTICVSSYYCVCPHTTVCPHTKRYAQTSSQPPHATMYVSSYYYVCPHILLCVCPHTKRYAQTSSQA
jgi:hypothetical protein